MCELDKPAYRIDAAVTYSGAPGIDNGLGEC
jgi:hypothetical protein